MFHLVNQKLTSSVQNTNPLKQNSQSSVKKIHKNLKVKQKVHLLKIIYFAFLKYIFYNLLLEENVVNRFK